MEASSEEHYRLTARRPAEVAISTAPHAVCKVSVASEARPVQEHLFAGYADGNGHLRFTIEASQTTDGPITITVKWDSLEGSGIRTIDIQFVSDAQMSRVISQVPQSEPWGSVRIPPLSEAEAMAATPAEIRAKRLPPKPDAEISPKLFEVWMEAVTKGITWVPPVPLPGLRREHKKPRKSRVRKDFVKNQVTFLNESLPNWSGAELRVSSQVQGVYGYWKVPPITGQSSNLFPEEQWMFQWVGIDGDSIPDLVQAGISEHLTISLGGFFQSAVYNAWSELLPSQQYSQPLSNFSVNANDSVYVQVDTTYDRPTHSLTGNYYILNQTTGQGTSMLSAMESFTPGSDPPLFEAEWIVERPELNLTNWALLANYGTTLMEDCAAIVDGVPVGYKGDPSASGMVSVNITMVDNHGTTLSDTSTETSIIQCNWRAKGAGEHV